MICGVWKLQKVKLSEAAACQKEAEEGAGVKDVVMDEYSFWPHGSGETMTGLNHLAWAVVEVCWAKRSSFQVLLFEEYTSALALADVCQSHSLGAYCSAQLFPET